MEDALLILEAEKIHPFINACFNGDDSTKSLYGKWLFIQLHFRKTGGLEFQDIRYGDMSMRLPRALSPAALRDLQVPHPRPILSEIPCICYCYITTVFINVFIYSMTAIFHILIHLFVEMIIIYIL